MASLKCVVLVYTSVFGLSLVACNIQWNHTKWKETITTPPPPLTAPENKRHQLCSLSDDKLNKRKICNPHVIKTVYSLIMLQFCPQIPLHASKLYRREFTGPQPSPGVVHAWRILCFATFSCRKVFSMPYFLLIPFTCFFFFTSSLIRSSSALLVFFFSRPLFSPSFMVKSLLDPDEIKRRVLMFIGWKKVHIVPERREFN